MNNQKIKFIQQCLNKDNANLIVDGIAGQATISAIRAVLAVAEDWTEKSCLVGYIQFLATRSGVECGPLDGYWGIKTSSAYDLILSKNDNEENFKIPTWPNSSMKELVHCYGQIGVNQTRITLPYPHKLAWDTDTIVNSYLCHEKVHDSLKRVLTRTLLHYGNEKIEQLNLNLWGGCLNVRTMRGGAKPSTHSWGIAVDYDPGHNQLKWGRDKALFAKSEYDAWWSFWEEDGWTSLGRTKDRDWMHIQAANL
ncbi:hypothetical protein [Maridesulfovibrio ferrireducens]|uniref:hypothetical protein n=1 Tax=Maridesulfovibrio ferrireducens TaxID=246191 RepID=UPI001A314775|nr:hypothetical protein [Maridesulfovibrio ferrireducens]MBI9111453.1 hypothetical protein [Maridesulfovibrio ferrireducens]